MKTLWLFLGMLVLANVAPSQSKVDSLMQLCKKATEKQKSGYFLELSFATRKDTATSNSYTRKAYTIAVKHHQIPEQANSFYYLGETSYYSRDYAGAIPFYQSAIPLFEAEKDSFRITNCRNAIGLCYHYMDQGEKAIEQFIEALKLCEKDKEYSAEITSNIAMAHSNMNNYTDALANYRKALTINTSINDSLSMAVNYNGIGGTFSNMAKFDSAIVNFFKAHKIFKKLNRVDYQAIALENIATINSNYPDSLDKALDYFNQAWAKFSELGLNFYEAEIKQGIGNIYLNQGKYKNALDAFYESLKLTDQFQRGFLLKMTNYRELSNVYEKMGDYKNALKYHILFAQYSDSLVQKEKYQQIVNLEKQYETEKKENEIIRLQARQELTDVQLQKNKQLKQLGFITATLLLVFAFFVLIKYIDKLKSNQLLEVKNQKIEQSEQELRLLNAAKNKFFSIIAHDLKNPFHTVMGYSYLLSNDYDNFTPEERRKFAFDIHQSTNNIFRLLQNLLDWSGSQTGRIKFSPLEVEFKRVLENSLGVMQALAEQKNITLKTNYAEDLKIFADPLMIETVLRNLINNAIKFTPENGLISISAQQTDGQVSVSISDSGIGIPEEDIQNLFRIDSKVKRKGTNDEDGSGLGLILCKEFVAKNNGTIRAESSPGKGSTFSFTIQAKAPAETKSLA